MSDVDLVEPVRASASRISGKYVFSHAVTESQTTQERLATYGVEFAWKPPKSYLQGGGSFWKGRRTLNPDNLTAEVHELDVALVDDDDDDDDDGRDIDADNVEPIDDDGGEDDEDEDRVRRVRHRRRPSNPRQDDGQWRNLFVTCNGNAIRIYETRRRSKPRCLQRYEDDDPAEQFYCVGWTYNVDGHHEWWACAAGGKGVLRVINAMNGTLLRSLTGHGEAINDLKVHPRDPALVLTASKDESLRLWNLRTGVTIAVFAGLKGHRGEVVFADFNRTGSKFASCGIDNSIRIWDIYDDDKVVDAIKNSHKVADLNVPDPYVYRDETGTRCKTKIVMSQFPYFVTRKVHKHYVDCVMWVGDLLLSKSVHNRMFLWEPDSDRESLGSPASNFTLLEEYVLDVCNVWFIRFALNRNRRLVACGNDKGMVSIFNLDDLPAKTCCTVQPPNKNVYNNCYVRQCAFSNDGSILIAVDDHAAVVQYDREAGNK